MSKKRENFDMSSFSCRKNAKISTCVVSHVEKMRKFRHEQFLMSKKKRKFRHEQLYYEIKYKTTLHILCLEIENKF